VGVDRGSIAHPFVGQQAGVEAGADETVVDEFGAVDGELEQGIICAAERDDGVDITVDLEVMVFELS
jgi:hypothetical protein